MAIKFVDVEPEAEKPKRSKQADAPAVKREPDAEALERPVTPELAGLQPKPKSQGRKKPLR